MAVLVALMRGLEMKGMQTSEMIKMSIETVRIEVVLNKQAIVVEASDVRKIHLLM